MENTHTYQLANYGERLLALIIDTMLVSVIGSVLGVGGGGGVWGGGLFSFLLGVGYQWYFLTQQHGQTPGKMLMKLQVIKVDGTEIRDADAVLRYFGYYINTTIAGLGWLWALIDSDRQGWHDKIAQTYVVKLDNDGKRKNDAF